jgi:hypothetical protein
MASTKDLFSSIEAKYRLPEGYLMRIRQLESSGGTNNYNAASGASGAFQFLPKTSKGIGLSDPQDLEASADAAARLAVQNRADLERRGIKDPDGKMLYLAHQQGAAGAATLLTSGDTPAAIALDRFYKPGVAVKAVVGNGLPADVSSSKAAEAIMKRYEGDTQVSSNSALGETGKPPEQGPPASPLGTTDKGIAALAAESPLSTADVLEGSSPEEDKASRKESYAIGLLSNAAQGLQRQGSTPMLPIPRLSFADGGIASMLPKEPEKTASQPEKPLTNEEEGMFSAKNGGVTTSDAERVIFIIRQSILKEEGDKHINARMKQLAIALKANKLFLLRLGDTVFVCRPLKDKTVEFHTATIENSSALLDRMATGAKSLKGFGYEHVRTYASNAGFLRIAKKLKASFKLLPKTPGQTRPVYQFDMDL